MKVRAAEVDPRTLELLTRNARYMRHETFKRLADNLQSDGALTSTPFCVPSKAPGKTFRVLSGNHRVKAAVAAELATILILVTDDPLTADQEKAIQLSHNALVGEDDPWTLKEIYESILEVPLKQYSGLDDMTLQLLGQVKVEPVPSGALEWTQVMFLFLPDEIERLKTAFAQIGGKLKPETVVGRFADYDRFMEHISLAGGAHGIGNTATSLMVLLEIFERHLEDLAEGFVPAAGQPVRKGRVPAAAALGSLDAPAATAVLIQKVLSRGEGKKKGDRWAPLDQALTAFLEAG